MKNDLLKRALRLYGRCVLSTVLGTFMYFSVGIITHAITPDTATLSPSASFLMHLVVLILQAFLSLTIISGCMTLPSYAVEDEGVVMRCGLTPTDIMHVRGDYSGFDAAVARLAAQYFLKALPYYEETDECMDALCEEVYDLVRQRLFENIVRAFVENSGPDVFRGGIDAQMKAVIDRTLAQWTKLPNKEFYYIMTAADSEDEAFETSLACFRGFAVCLQGSKEKGVIRGGGVYEAGAVKGTKYMQEAYEMGRNV